jgi:protein-tyrosine phosphatase
VSHDLASGRHVTLTNIFNFRDLGGYPTKDRRTVRWRRLYRSDDLSKLHRDDHATFRALGIRTVVDLRRPAEIDEDGRIPAVNGIAYHHAHLAHPDWPRRSFADSSQRADYIAERYLEMCDEGGSCIGGVLRLIADASTAPLVFHCLAGKDRTGIVAALTLALLGVDDETIADDYTLSERAEPDAWAYLLARRPERALDLGPRWTHFVISPREGMLSLFQSLREQHGSIEGYAASVGVTAAHVDAMRAHLLSPE